jgi:signal transduction histidine kinase
MPSSRPRCDRRRAPVITFMEDITAQVAAHEARRDMEEKIQETAKLEALGVLAGGIAHDFNNLLVAILGYAGLARSEVTPGSDAARDLAAIETAAQRAADLARQMLAYSGRGRFTVTPIASTSSSPRWATSWGGPSPER